MITEPKIILVQECDVAAARKLDSNIIRARLLAKIARKVDVTDARIGEFRDRHACVFTCGVTHDD